MRFQGWIDRLNRTRNIRRAAREAQDKLDAMYAVADPPDGSALDQCGLRDGLSIIEEFLEYGEPGLALEHLVHVTCEPPLRLSAASLKGMASAARSMGMLQWMDERLSEAGLN